MKVVLYITAGIVIGIAIVSIIVRMYIKTHFRNVKRYRNGEVEIDLKPCPFCGKDCQEVVTSERNGNMVYSMVCDVTQGGCGCSTGWSDRSIDVVLMWNERAEDKVNKNG